MFFDDILIYNKSFEEHLSHLEKAFRVLLEGKSFLKLSKCTFAQHQVEYLGHLVSEQGVESVQAKVQATQQWPDPRSFKSLHGFLGLTGFYRYFIKSYATITTHLTQLLTKDQFGWPQEAQQAFDALKDVVNKALVLLLIDASGVGMGAVLSHQGHPIAFFSKPFCSKLLHALTYVRELFTITVFVKKWHQYLLGHHFTILTDHQSLKDLMTQVVQNLEQQMYLARLIGYDYSIQYCSGTSNLVANALSWIPKNSMGELLLLSVPNFIFLQELKQELSLHLDFIAFWQALLSNPIVHPDCTITRDLIIKKGHI